MFFFLFVVSGLSVLGWQQVFASEEAEVFPAVPGLDLLLENKAKRDVFRMECLLNPKLKKYINERLLEAVKGGCSVERFDALLAAGADIRVRGEDGWSLLHYAASCGSVAIVKKLVKKHPAKVNARTGYGETPLHLAVKSGHKEVVACLLAEPCIDPNVKAKGQVTAANLAAEFGWDNEDIVSLLSAATSAAARGKNFT